MGYFNVTLPNENLVDGEDIAITKSVSMLDWQQNLTKTLQNATTITDQQNNLSFFRK